MSTRPAAGPNVATRLTALLRAPAPWARDGRPHEQSPTAGRLDRQTLKRLVDASLAGSRVPPSVLEFALLEVSVLLKDAPSHGLASRIGSRGDRQ